jgi:hypothetical protein
VLPEEFSRVTLSVTSTTTSTTSNTQQSKNKNKKVYSVNKKQHTTTEKNSFWRNLDTTGTAVTLEKRKRKEKKIPDM